jgi:succinylarginine dihydrolase
MGRRHMMNSVELNLDGLVGPTHNYAGLAAGNLASQRNRKSVSHPRAAALQGLAKMKYLADLGVPQAILPPQERPDIAALRRLGFGGNDAQVLQAACQGDAALLAGCASASAMWAANAATVSPSADAADAHVHFTPANLVSQFHRSLETPTVSLLLQKIFGHERMFVHHPALPAAAQMSDEGAANHTRLAMSYDAPGIELFVFGRDDADAARPMPARFPGRQNLAASQAIARLHALDPTRVIFAQQNPEAIDAGAFHNDVVAVGNLNVLLYHQRAFVEVAALADRLRRAFAEVSGGELVLIEVPESQVPLQKAVDCYLFNSQIVSLGQGKMSLIAPTESRDDPAASAFLGRLLQMGTPIQKVYFVDVRQSMQNGGGPACLRLRVALTKEQLAQVHPGVMLRPELVDPLTLWIERYYRTDLHPDDLRDPKLLVEGHDALDALTDLLHLGPIYGFQV